MTNTQAKSNLNAILRGDHALLDQLLVSSITGVPPVTGQAVSRQAMLVLLQPLVDSRVPPGNLLAALAEKLTADQHIVPADWRRLRVIDVIFDHLPKKAQIDPAIMAQLQRLRAAYGQLALLDNSLLASTQHSAHQLIDDICFYSIGWHPGLEKSGEPFVQRLQQSISNILASFDADPSSLEVEQLSLSELLKKDVARMEKVAARRCESEVGKVKVQYAEIKAQKSINYLTKERLLPVCATDFLQGPWLEVLRLIQLHHGSDSEFWGQALKIAEDMVFSLQPSPTDKQRSQQIEIIAELADRILALMQQLAINDDRLQQAEALLAAIEIQHIQILKSLEPESIAVVALTELDAVVTVDPIESFALLADVLKLAPGQWMLYKNPQGDWERCQLARKIEGINQLLFVNSLGIKVMAASLGELGQLMSSKNVRAIDPCKAFQHSYRALLSQLVQRNETVSKAATS